MRIHKGMMSTNAQTVSHYSDKVHIQCANLFLTYQRINAMPAQAFCSQYLCMWQTIVSSFNQAANCHLKGGGKKRDIKKERRTHTVNLNLFSPALIVNVVSIQLVYDMIVWGRRTEGKRKGCTVRKHGAKEMIDEACRPTHLWPAVRGSQLRRSAAAASGARFWLHWCYWSDIL